MSDKNKKCTDCGHSEEYHFTSIFDVIGRQRLGVDRAGCLQCEDSGESVLTSCDGFKNESETDKKK